MGGGFAQWGHRLGISRFTEENKKVIKMMQIKMSVQLEVRRWILVVKIYPNHIPGVNGITWRWLQEAESVKGFGVEKVSWHRW